VKEFSQREKPVKKEGGEKPQESKSEYQRPAPKKAGLKMDFKMK